MNEVENKIKNFRELRIWQTGKHLSLEVYKATDSFPKAEFFGIVSQMRRSSISIVSNIAEGFNRAHTNEYKQFLYIALGSCAELETQLEISRELGYLKPDVLEYLLEKLDHESRMIRSLINKLK